MKMALNLSALSTHILLVTNFMRRLRLVELNEKK